MTILIRFAHWASRLCRRAAALGSVGVALLLLVCLFSLASKSTGHAADGADDLMPTLMAGVALLLLPQLLARPPGGQATRLVKLSAGLRRKLRLLALLAVVLPACLAILLHSISAGFEVLGQLLYDRRSLPASWVLRLLMPLGFLLATLQTLVEVLKAIGIDPDS